MNPAYLLAPSHTRAVSVDDFGGVDGLVAHGGVDVAVAGDELGDVWRHAVQHGVDDEQAAEVVRSEPQRPFGGVGDAGAVEGGRQEEL